MAGPTNKKPSIFQQAKARPAEAPSRSQTEHQDEHKRKQLLVVAAQEARLRPNSKTLNRGLLTAMALDEAFKVYREAIKALRKSMHEKLAPGQRGFIRDAQKRYEELRALKALAEEDVVAEANKLHPIVGQLSRIAEEIVNEAKT